MRQNTNKTTDKNSLLAATSMLNQYNFLRLDSTSFLQGPKSAINRYVKDLGYMPKKPKSTDFRSFIYIKLSTSLQQKTCSFRHQIQEKREKNA